MKRSTQCMALTLTASALALALALALATAGAVAQGYPVKPVTIVVPSVPGGANDTGARLAAPKLAELLGQPVVVDNRPAGAGQVGTNQVAQAAPDGYTLIVVFDSFATNPYLFRDVKYDPVRDFSPVTLMGRSAQVLVVHPGLGPRTVSELVQLARARGSALDWGTAGPGTSSRFKIGRAHV